MKKKKVLVAVTVNVETEVPEDWEPGWVQYSLDHRSVCYGNVIQDIAERDEQDSEENFCNVCNYTEVKYLKEIGPLAEKGGFVLSNFGLCAYDEGENEDASERNTNAQ